MDEPSTYLTPRQHARVEALREARAVLAMKNMLASGPVKPQHLMTIANYILTGHLEERIDWPPTPPVSLREVELDG